MRLKTFLRPKYIKHFDGSWFLARAKRHGIEGRDSESFLNFVIAVDLLFGGTEEIAKTIAKRVAAVVCRGVGKPYKEVKARVVAFYGMRSRYVHRGTEVNLRECSDLEQICLEVLRCLLRFQLRPQSRKPGAVANWLTRIDFIVAKLEAGDVPTQSELEENGVVK